MNQYNVFFIPHGDDGSAAEVLNGFLRSHRVLQVERSVTDNGWSFCVEWSEGKGIGKPMRSPEKIDYMETLPPDVFNVFSKLRKVRKSLAEAEGVAAFTVATDAQLAVIAGLEKPSVAELRKIDGFGDARVKKYGAKLLEAMGVACCENNEPLPAVDDAKGT